MNKYDLYIRKALENMPTFSFFRYFHNTISPTLGSVRFIARDFFYFLQSVYQNSYMIRSMVMRDIRARYIGSLLGFFWTIIHPLIQILMYYFIFSVILKIRLGPEYGGANFATWLIAGLLPWFFFAEVVSRAPTAVLEQSDIITKTVFPSELLPLAHLISAIINHLISLGLFIGILLGFGYGISFKLLLIFPSMFTIGVFAIGISWALSSLNVFLRDIGQIIGVVIHIWFFMTPILYPIHSIPEHIQKVYKLNPMLHVIEAYRFALLGNAYLTIESLSYIAIPVLVAFILGGLIFKKLKPAFADIL